MAGILRRTDHAMRAMRVRTLAAAGAAMTLATGLIWATPAAAEPTSPDDFGEPTSEQIAASIQVWDPTGSVSTIESVTVEGEETVLSLDSDILFEFGSAKLPPSAAAAIADLIVDVPQGAQVSVIGHTDDVGTDSDNLTLSIQRAETVAAAVAAARPDLVLVVEGRGEADPVESNSSPEGREANRRVEIRYVG